MQAGLSLTLSTAPLAALPTSSGPAKAQANDRAAARTLADNSDAVFQINQRVVQGQLDALTPVARQLVLSVGRDQLSSQDVAARYGTSLSIVERQIALALAQVDGIK